MATERPAGVHAEQVTGPVAEHGEGPVWHSGRRVLHFVDMLAGDLLTFDPAGGGLRRRHVAGVLAALRPRRGGGLVLGVERGFALLDSPDAEPRVLDPLWTDPGLRMNDGGCDPAGRFFCGSMAYDTAPNRGTLYRLDPDLRTAVALSGATISNGLAWSPDGGTAYFADTATRRVDALGYDLDTGTFTGRRPFAVVPDGSGSPDGLTVDAEGHVWVALWGGSAVHRYAPDGRLVGTVALPVPYVSACTFGGTDLGDLYITTSTKGPGAADHPASGALFRVRTGTAGLPAAEFAG